MRFSLRRLLPVLLLCSPVVAQAVNHVDGDYWIVHTKEAPPRDNEVFVVDIDPTHVKRTGGVASFEVHQVFNHPRNAMLTSYGIEADCAKKRVRIKRAEDIEGPMGGVRSVKVSSAWQAQPEPWLAASRDFVCLPDQRMGNGIAPIGQMHMLRMVDAAKAYFSVLQREQRRDAILKDIYDAIDRMPQK